MTDTAPATTPRWTEYQPIDQLVPADRNSKDHDQVALGASVASFGFVEPVVVDERTGKLLAGHGRTDYLRTLHTTGLPVDWPEGAPWPPDGVVVTEDGAWHVQVVRGVASRDDEHAEAMGIALNRVGERGGWKYDILVDSLGSLRDSGLLDATGFDADYLDDLIAQTQAPSLDDLEGKYGQPDPTHLWPVLRFKIPPADRDRYLRLVEGLEGGDDVLFAHLLALAERP